VNSNRETETSASWLVWCTASAPRGGRPCRARPAHTTNPRPTRHHRPHPTATLVAPAGHRRILLPRIRIQLPQLAASLLPLRQFLSFPHQHETKRLPPRLLPPDLTRLHRPSSAPLHAPSSPEPRIPAASRAPRHHRLALPPRPPWDPRRSASTTGPARAVDQQQ
jgi:hypothetical protein